MATFSLFCQSFLFILCGAPLVEATHGDLKFTAPLTGITVVLTAQTASYRPGAGRPITARLSDQTIRVAKPR